MRKLIVLAAAAVLAGVFAVAAWSDDGSVSTGSNVSSSVVSVTSSATGGSVSSQVISVSGANGASSVSVNGKNGANGSDGKSVSCSITSKTVGNVTTTTQTGDCSGVVVASTAKRLPWEREHYGSTWLWLRALCK